MEDYVPDPKHLKEWKRIQANYLSMPNTKGGEFQYRARCLEGLITGNTLDFKVA